MDSPAKYGCELSAEIEGVGDRHIIPWPDLGPSVSAALPAMKTRGQRCSAAAWGRICAARRYLPPDSEWPTLDGRVWV